MNVQNVPGQTAPTPRWQFLPENVKKDNLDGATFCKNANI
jgi:hypothetical protein